MIRTIQATTALLHARPRLALAETGMGHDDPNILRLEPGETNTLT